MDLHSRRPGMFENSRSSGMWPAEPPSGNLSLFSSFADPAKSLNAVDVLGRLPTPSSSYPVAPSFLHHDPRLPVVVIVPRTAAATSLAPQIVA